MDDRYMTVVEVSEYLQIQRATLYRWLKVGRVPGHKVGHTWRFSKDEIDAWVRSGRAAETTKNSGEDN